MGIQWPAHWLPTRRRPFRESGWGESSRALNSATSWHFSWNLEHTVWCARVCFIALLRPLSTAAKECMPAFYSFTNGAVVNKGRNIKKRDIVMDSVTLPHSDGIIRAIIWSLTFWITCVNCQVLHFWRSIGKVSFPSFSTEVFILFPSNLQFL